MLNLSIVDLLATTRQRRDKTIVWTNPAHPIICAIANASIAIDGIKLANSNQLNRTFSYTSLTAGVPAHIKPRLMMYAEAQQESLPISRTQSKVLQLRALERPSVIGHSRRTQDLGVTADYGGARTDDL